MRINDLFEDLLQSVYTRTHGGALAGFETAYNDMVKNTGKKLWRGMLQVAASGFGKGVLIMAGVALAGFMGWGALTFYADSMPVETGLAEGFKAGLGLLGSKIGLVMMAIGGTLGAVSEVHKAHSRMTAAVAQMKAKDMGLTHQLQKAKEAPLVKAEIPEDLEKPWNATLETGFAAREKQRREEKTFAQQMGIT